MKTCPDCGARVGEKHKDGCDVERCPHCGGQALGCLGFDPNDPHRQAWDGQWPGETDCERLGFFVNGDRSLPDINRLFAECDWSTTLRPQGGGGGTDTAPFWSSDKRRPSPGHLGQKAGQGPSS